MNERIKELAGQAGCSIDGMGYGEGNVEKFAELIVQECANVSNQAEKQCQHPGTMIKKHFGVE